ncbi:carbohydrate esterase family 4 protein [Collybiopsis luxurians FD-317 M1]|uniref:Carbohydrate esterase family 4 protein n=1 Tax=Collybiopsis luxurians FD-317 M1 TaxID=944289 RepID=A0A0D0BEM4_9AGAR|nr:carbohydrate esterase family 4 protein [Collybiopsis luxurians FD-317 M1]
MSTEILNGMEYGPRDLKGYGQHTPDPQWPGNAKIAINIVINYEEGSELTPVNGDNTTEVLASELGPGVQPMEGMRNVNMESLYEYGSRVGVWRILRLLKEYQIPSTCYAVGRALEMNPEVAIALEEEGHEIGSHGWRWVDRSGWTEEEEAENARKTLRAIAELAPSKRPPRGWYHGMVGTKAHIRSRSLIAQVFKSEGAPLLWYSDDYSDDLPYWIPYPGGKKEEGLLIVPYSLDNNDYKNTSYQGFTTPDDFAQYLIASFDELYAEGESGHAKMMSIGLHCRIIGRPGRIAGLRKFIEYVRDKETSGASVWWATREQIASHWIDKFPYKPSEA